MKKIVAVLLALVMLLTATPAVFAETAGESVAVQSGTTRVTETDAIEFTYKPDTDGVLTVQISANPGFRLWVFNAETDETLSLPESGTSGEYTYNLTGGVSYRVYIIGYYEWSEAAAKITYAASFVAQEVEAPLLEIDDSGVVLELGTNTVELLENAVVSLYSFVPAEPGVYTVTVEEGVTMAIYSFTRFLLAEAQDGVVTHTATAAEQTFLVGLTSEASSVTVTIEKTGDYTPPEQIVYQEYEPVDTLVSDFEEPAELVSLDISKKQVVVLGSDGYYHLATADGPVVYVNLNNEQFVLAMLFEAGAPITMRGTYVDEAGEEHPYDFMNMIANLYYEYSREYDYHPLNTDLMIFLKAYGTAQAWYKPETSAFTTIINGEFVEESAWLASCYSTVDYVEPVTSWTELEVTAGGITEVPDSLKAAGLETPEAVKEALVQAILSGENGVESGNIAHYDVTLMFTNDAGESWTAADATQFPENGKLTVTIPYPAGTNKNYTFTVAHMFTSDAFGKTPGDVELPKVTNTKTGIQFEVTGLSPIAVGWTAPVTPSTGDSSPLMLLIVLMLISACGITVLASKKYVR